MNCADLLRIVRTKQPLIHHITNWVTIYDCAQVVKSFGASPVMAHAPEEAEDMTGLASALVLNIGTLSTEIIQSMKLAAAAARRKGIPVVLDVCGAGATPFRDRMSLELIDTGCISIIKGNASEVARVAGREIQTRGVDTAAVEENLVDIATGLARQRVCVTVITGKEDIVADGISCYTVRNGHPVMSRVVGTGCMAASVIGTFAAVGYDDIASAAAAGLCCYEVAAELAVSRSLGPGSFKQTLFDVIETLSDKEITSMGRIAP